MVSIKDHGGNFGGGKPPFYNSKVIKGLVPLPFSYGPVSGSINGIAETQNYVWVLWSVDLIVTIVNKRDPSDVKHFRNNGNFAFSISQAFMPIYEADRIMIIGRANHLGYINADGTTSRIDDYFNQPVGQVYAYKYDATAKTFYMVREAYGTTGVVFTAIDLTNISLTKDTVIDTLSTVSDNQYLYVLFEDNAFRVINTKTGALWNKRYDMFGSLITNYGSGLATSLNQEVNPYIKATKDYKYVLYFKAGNIERIDINTGAVLASTTYTSIRDAMIAKYGKSTWTWSLDTNGLQNAVALKDGNFAIVLRAAWSNLSYAPVGLFFVVIDSNFSVKWIETAYKKEGHNYFNTPNKNLRNVAVGIIGTNEGEVMRTAVILNT